MRILTLDLGTKLGWAFADTETDHWIWGEEDFSLQRYEGGGIRYIRFERWLVEMFGSQPPDLVVMEEVAFAKFQQAAEILNGMKAVLMAHCERRKVAYTGVPVGTLKKFATGKGNCGKDDMAVFLAANWDELRPGNSLQVTASLSDNEVDAIWLLAYALRHLVPEEAPQP